MGQNYIFPALLVAILSFSCYLGVCSYEVKLEPPSNEPTASNKGMVLVRSDSSGSWGSVCDDYWDINDAKVVCRMLGFSDAESFHITSAFGALAGFPIVLDDVECSGLEKSLSACRSTGLYGSNNCGTSEQAGVTCKVNVYNVSLETSQYQVRILPNELRARHKGTVLVRYNSTSSWGTICDDQWDIRDGNVVCRMLGYPNASAVHLSSEFGSLEVFPYLIDDVECNGTESNLAECATAMFGSSSCKKIPLSSRNGNAGVTCKLPEYEVRLEPPNNDKTAKHKGTVLVRYNSTSAWGTVCDEEWDINDGNVVCRMLGFPNATAVHYSSVLGVHVQYPTLLDGLDCSGNESNIASCWTWKPFGDHECNHTKQAGVTCFRETCTNDSCSGHGKCYNVEDGTTVCVCDYGYTSKNCAQVREVCTRESCSRHGKCYNVEDGTISCACDTGYTSKNCDKDANVMRRLDISATYRVLCQRLDTRSTILQDVIEFRFHDVEEIISGLAVGSRDGNATMACMNDVLRVTWPTNLVYTADVTDIPHDANSKITSKLSKKLNLLELFLPTNIPPVLRPQTTSQGFLAELVLTSYCKNKSTYSSATDSCNGH